MARKREQPEHPEPLRAYGPDGEIVALSYDGGKTWSAVPKKEPEEKLSREYKRRLIAIADPADIWCARRLIPILSELPRTEVYAGWGPPADVLPVAGQADGLLVPAQLITTELISQIKMVAKDAPETRILIDVPAPLSNAAAAMLLNEVLEFAHAVLVPSDRIAMQMRRLHPSVFVLPPVLPVPLPPATKTKRDVLTIAVQETRIQGISTALNFITDRYTHKVRVVEDKWLERHPNDDPAFYQDVDILVAGPPRWPEQVSTAAVLPAMAAACCPVVDRAYIRAVRDGVNGKVISRSDATSWRRALISVLEDARLRVHLARGARSTASRNTSIVLLGQIVRPFRIVLPEREPFRVPLI